MDELLSRPLVDQFPLMGGRRDLVHVRAGSWLKPVTADLGIERTPGLALLPSSPTLPPGSIAAQDRQRAHGRTSALLRPDEALGPQDRQRPIDRRASRAVPG